MNPAHLIGAGLLLLTVLSVVVGVLLHQRAELKHRAAGRLDASTADKLHALIVKYNDSTDVVLSKFEERLKDAENELIRIGNRGGRTS